MSYLTFLPKEVESAKAIMYIHGSAYMNAPHFAQFSFAAEMARKTHAKVYFPLYPKLPASTAVACFALMNNFFVFLRKKGDIVLVGDSSGGALALSLAAMRSEVGEVIAISPWVSLLISEEGRRADHDVMLSTDLLDRVAALWAKDVSYDDPRLSPIQGTFKGKKILLTCGERERFRPDILRFFEEKAEQGATLTYLEGRGQQHCYPLMPTPEGRAARAEIYLHLQRVIYGRQV